MNFLNDVVIRIMRVKSIDEDGLRFFNVVFFDIRSGFDLQFFVVISLVKVNEAFGLFQAHD